jgi:hypothetical protein
MYTETPLYVTFLVHTPGKSPIFGLFEGGMYMKTALEATFVVHIGYVPYIGGMYCPPRPG